MNHERDSCECCRNPQRGPKVAFFQTTAPDDVGLALVPASWSPERLLLRRPKAGLKAGSPPISKQRLAAPPPRHCTQRQGLFAPQMTGFTDSKTVPGPLRARM